MGNSPERKKGSQKYAWLFLSLGSAASIAASAATWGLQGALWAATASCLIMAFCAYSDTVEPKDRGY